VWAVLVAPAYLLGTFPSAALVARASGIDIHASGSRNPGASNVSRMLGWRKGIIVFALDALKGVVAAGVGLWLGGRAGGYVLGIAAVVGHVFPISRRGRGGKGVASAGGVIAVLHPIVFVVIITLWVAVHRLTRRAAIASLAAVVAAPIGAAVAGRAAWEVAATAGLAALLIARHADNIRRLLGGTEHRL
jgi:glycerol-3-phosphate acyltransferase PlsY